MSFFCFHKDCFHTRADSQLQWRIVIAIFELLSEHTREKNLQSLWFSIPEWGEEAWLVSVFFWHAHWYFIWNIIFIRTCKVYQRKWVVVKASAQWFCCVIWEMHHWKTPPDNHLNCAIQRTYRDANLHTHRPKYRH